MAASALFLGMVVAVCPKLPFERHFDFDVSPGLQLTLTGQTNEAYHKGLVSPFRKGFIINFCGENIYDGSRVFHVNPRFDINSTLVLNTKMNSTWGVEERHPHHHMDGAQDFSLVVQAHENEFKIFVNGRHFADYKYRKPLSSIHAISLKGLLTVHQFVSKQYELADLPLIAEYTPSDVTIQPDFPIFIENLTIPADIQIPGQNQLGLVVAIVGIPLHQNGFFIRWMTSDDDIAFELNPRLNENTIVIMNTVFQGAFGSEDYLPNVPFQVNERFYLLVKTRLTHYEIWVNGEHVHNFAHREVPFQHVNKITISEYQRVHIDNVTLTY